MLLNKNTVETTVKSLHSPFTKGGGGGILICILCSVFILAGCATTEDVGRIQWDINELKSEVKNIKQKSKVLESQIPGQEEQLNKRLKALEEEQKVASTAVPDLLMKVQTLTTEVQVMTGRLEELRYFSEKSLKELTESKNALIAQVKELEIAVNELRQKHARSEPAKPHQYESIPTTERQKPPEDVKKAEEKPDEPEKTEKEEKVPEREVKDVYMEAYQAYKANQFEKAREKFHAVLRDYPENEYSDNARFWMGESYYKEKNYEDAILAYEELLKKSLQSDKVPGAMLKQGFAFYEMNDQKTGRIILEKLIEKFPDSKEATLAKKKISPPAPAGTTKKKQ